MTESKLDRHNRLAREFVDKVAAQTTSEAEFMVVVETTMLASLTLLHRLHGRKPADAGVMVETAIQQATERFIGVLQKT